MPSWTPEQYNEHLLRNAVRQPSPEDAVERESDLHEQIIELCRERGFYPVHSRMDRRTSQALGVPDFIIALPGGKTLFLECKAKGRKATPEQNAAIAHLKSLGHCAEIVNNIERVRELVYAGTP